MWHWQLSALATGCEIVLYDGPIRDAATLWRIVQDERVTVFGTSPPYLKLSEDSGLAPGRGAVAAMPQWAGESVGGVTRVQPAAEIVRELAEEAERLLRRW